MERVWLHNPITGGDFHCPVEAAEHWCGLGWEPADPPPEVNLALVDRIAWESEQADKRAVAEVVATKSRNKSAAAGGQTEEN